MCKGERLFFGVDDRFVFYIPNLGKIRCAVLRTRNFQWQSQSQSSHELIPALSLIMERTVINVQCILLIFHFFSKWIFHF
jgi:hypothetical protein